MKRLTFAIMVIMCILVSQAFTMAEHNSYPQTLPVFQVDETPDLTITQMQQILYAFYGDQFSTMRFVDKEYKTRGIAQWRNDSLGLIANISNTHLNLTRETEFTIIYSNAGGGYRDELPWYKEDGTYTYDEALNMVNSMLSTIGVSEASSLKLINVYYEDPSMTKTRQNYYAFIFVPVINGVPLSYSFGNRNQYEEQDSAYVRVDVTNEGIVRIKAINHPIALSKAIKNVQIIDPQTIDFTQVHDSFNLENLRVIHSPTAEDLKIASDRLYYDSDGTHYSVKVTSYTPVWNLRYVTRLESNQFLLKPVWILTAREFMEGEIIENFAVLFDAETGMEMIP